MNNKLFDALETCLQALEKGETLDTALSRYPALKADLRPLLEASLHARSLRLGSGQALAGSPVSDVVQRRARSRLLQRAAEMREAKRAPRRTWLFNFRPLAVTLMLVVFFLSGTGLVNASTTSLPGDNLYPVKRTWEDMRLLFVFAHDEREGLEMEYENERLEEISELLAEGRVEPISFSGYVTAQTDGQWTVSGILVTITAQTVLPAEPVVVGSVVTVYGMTTLDGNVEAQSVDIVPAGTPIPTPKPEDENESEGSDDDEGGDTRQETGPGPTSDEEAKDSGEDSQPGEKSKIAGVIESISGTIWVVNGQMVNVGGAEISGAPTPGDKVVIEGHLDANGMFVATKVSFDNGGSDDSGGGSDDSDTSDSGDDDPPDDGDN